MKRKSMLILALLLVFSASFALYAIPSTFSVGTVGYYSYYDLEAENYDAYTPGLRAEFYISDFLGFSADAIVIDSIPDYDYYEMIYMIDVVLRAPLGLIEPYIATGPAYHGVIVGDYSSPDEEAFAYNVRGGVDFNILDWLSVGIESNFLVDDVGEFFDTMANSTSEEIATLIKDYSLIGITAKVKF
jgi:opacity protein-like surface antigen